MNTLPQNFRTWNEFYASIKENITSETDIVGYDFMVTDATDPKGFRTLNYRFTLKEIKAYCFDEFIEWYGKHISYDQWEPNSPPAYYIVDKIDHFIGYKRQHA